MSRLQELYKAAMSGNAGEQELDELKQLLADPTHASHSTELIRNAIIEGYGKGEPIADERLVLMQQAIMETVPIHDQAVRRVNFLASPKLKIWFRYAAAVIILFGAGIYLLLHTMFRRHHLPGQLLHLPTDNKSHSILRLAV